MQSLSNSLFSNLDQLEKVRTRKPVTNLSTRHQVEGAMYAKKLGAKKPSEFSHVIKCFKVAPNISMQAYSWVSDYPNARNLLGLFFWRYYTLKREREQ